MTVDNRPLIAVFGANPAWQKTLYFSEFRPFEVNRAAGIKRYAGGKGVNFCRAAGCRGAARTRLYQFSGGANGREHEAALRGENIDFCNVEVEWETRCCTTCLDGGGRAMTELIEPSHAPSASAMAEMLEIFDAGLAEASGVAIAGSLPDGTPKTLYTEVAVLAAKHSLPLLVDAVHADTLDAVRKFVLKINMDELKQLTGCEDAGSALSAGAARWPESVLAITDGGAAAFLAAEGGLWRYALPKITVVSALGAGDTCSAVLLSELLIGTSPVEAFACGLAAASANCLTPLAGEFKRSDCGALMPRAERL